jgi:hypothetical protein
MHKYEHRNTKDAGARGVQLLHARLVLMRTLLQARRATCNRSLEFLCYKTKVILKINKNAYSSSVQK